MSIYPCLDEIEKLKSKLACVKSCKSFSNGLGALISPYPNFPSTPFTSGPVTINATGESTALIGRIRIADGSASKTFSSAGGKVYFLSRTGNIFVDSGTVLRAGIQDLDASGIEDGTFDVYGDFIGGTDLIPDETLISIPITSGSRNIANGETLAIAIEMVTRGDTDTVHVYRHMASFGGLQVLLPYFTQDTGSGPVKFVTGPPALLIQFDDGTLGYMGDLFPFILRGDFIQPSSTPNEFASIFKLPITSNLSEVRVLMGNGGGDLEVGIYSNPLGDEYPYGLPKLEWSTVIDGDLTSQSAAPSAMFSVIITPEFRAVKNKMYAVAFKPTTINGMYVSYLDLGNSIVRNATPLGENWAFGYRDNDISPFTVSDSALMAAGLYFSDFYC